MEKYAFYARITEKGVNMNDFGKAMNYRHACKLFDTSKGIDDRQMHFILEAGRKSPSAFGMEPWKFLVIADNLLKEKIRPLCWGQPQITSCSHLVIILAAIENLKPSSGIPAKRFSRRPLPQEKIDAYIELYENFLQETLSNDKNIFAYSSKQCYIAMANMLTGAASIGIDSCPIEGFEKNKLEELLEIDTTKYQIAVLAPFGYRANKQSEQLRLPLEEIVEYR